MASNAHHTIYLLIFQSINQSSCLLIIPGVYIILIISPIFKYIQPKGLVPIWHFPIYLEKCFIKCYLNCYVSGISKWTFWAVTYWMWMLFSLCNHAFCIMWCKKKGCTFVGILVNTHSTITHRPANEQNNWKLNAQSHAIPALHSGTQSAISFRAPTVKKKPQFH